MTHDFFTALPSQQLAAPGAHPVVAAGESARYLHEQLDMLPTATAADRQVLQQELTMLRHWLLAAETESGEYQAVVGGLAHFADQAEILLSATEFPDVPTPR